MIGELGSRGLFQLRDHAPRVHLVLVLLSMRGRLSKLKKEDSSLKTCHDQEARKMAEQRMARKNKIPMTNTSQQGKKAARSHTNVENFSAEISAEIDAVGTTV